MMLLYLASALAVVVLAYVRARLWVITATLILIGAVATASQGASLGLILGYWLPLLPVAFLLNARPLRRRLLSAKVRAGFARRIPPLSATERTALEAGTVWWDGQLFTGKPDWDQLLSLPLPSFRREEQAFLDGPVEELCRMLDDWQITRELNDLPEEIWEFLRDQRFFGMNIPRAGGGLGFSARANSAVVMKIASRSQTAAITVMVPNALGPGELLVRYGTREQKDHYLPRLARGDELPCFALTGPYAGSDAAAMPDEGVVCKRRIRGQDVLGFRVSWNKRYITLAPVATLIGLAFRARDPEGLLGSREDLGITCALVSADSPGVKMGDRHRPTGASFMNGPVEGKDVFIPLDHVIGGRDQIGRGWTMLMHCLSAGRGISLPALGTASSKLALAAAGGYARIRKQFRAPIADFEGIEEVLADMAARTYRMDAARELTLTALDQGQEPAVVSAILKYHLTEDYRRNVLDAMDVHGGKAVVEGPANYLAGVYQSIPIAITVEGANILTRSLIIFGQGLVRCHPFLLAEMRAAQDPDTEAGMREFDIALFGHVGFAISNAVRAVFMALTGNRWVQAPVDGPLERWFAMVQRFSSAFALVADLLLLTAGGRLKGMERMSGRLADVLSHLYLASAVLKRHADHGQPTDDLPVVELALTRSFQVIQDQLIGVLNNFPIPWLGKLVRELLFPWGRPVRDVSDQALRTVAAGVTDNGAVRERLVSGIFLETDTEDGLGPLEDAFGKVLASQQAESALRNALQEDVTPLNVEELVAKGLATGILTEEQAELVRVAQEAVGRVIQVDQFGQPQRTASRRTVRGVG